jgi:hypothetical protein
MKKYTQSEANRLAAQVKGLTDILNQQKNSWSSDWPDSTRIADLVIGNERVIGAIDTARKLKHAVVVTVSGQTLIFHACELPKA